jgi:hypothetical protein
MTVPQTREQVEAAAARMFGRDSVKVVLLLLDKYPAESEVLDESGRARVHLAILKLSEGRIDELNHHVEQARMDFRDVLYWADY